MLKLYQFDRSPFGWKVRFVLAEKNVPYDAIVPENKAESAEFVRLNPFRLTPVLVLEDGRTLYESTVVNEYLEETYPTPAMLPRDPYERARVRMIEDAADQYLYPAIRDLRNAGFEYAPPYLIPKPPQQVDEPLQAAARTKIHAHLAVLERELVGRSWFGGESVSLADATLAAPLTGSLRLLGVLPDARYANLEAWTRRLQARPAYAASAPKQPLTIKSS